MKYDPDTRPLIEKLDTPDKRRAYNRDKKRAWRARKRIEAQATPPPIDITAYYDAARRLHEDAS